MMSFLFFSSYQNSIVHRDLKLENILLDANKLPKVRAPFVYIVMGGGFCEQDIHDCAA